MLTTSIAFIALTAQTQAASPLETRVTLRETATIERLLEAVSRASHVPLLAGRQNAKTVLIVAVDQVPLKDLMDRVAWATFGRWEKSGEGYRLVADVTLERKAEREYVAAAAKIAKDGIDQYRANVLKPGSTDSEIVQAARPKEVNPYTIIQNAPNARAMARLLGAIRAEDLVDLSHVNGSVVYATHPVGQERPLGPRSLEVLSDYLKEVGLADTPLPDGRPGHQFILKASSTIEGGWADLSLFDPSGTPVLSKMVRNVVSFSAPEVVCVAPKEIRDAIPVDMPVPLSPASQFNIGRQRIPGEADYSLTEKDFAGMSEVVERLRNPEKYEPLGTFATDIWRAVGRQMNRNVVANVEDYLFVPTINQKQLMLRQVLMWRYPRTKVEMTPGWIGVRPSLPNAPWGHQVDREALGRFVRTTATTDLERWTAAAEFIDRSGVTSLNSFVTEYLSWAMGGRYHVSFEESSPIWVFASLTPDQRRAWLNGQTIDLSVLSPQAKERVKQWVLRDMRWSHGVGFLNAEPTRLFPQGYPAAGRLECRVSQEEGLFVRSTDPNYNLRGWLSIETFANYLNYNTSGQNGRPVVNLDHIQIHRGSRRTLLLSATLAPNGLTGETRLYVNGPDNGDYVSWKQAPADLAEQIRAVREKG